MRDAVEVKDFKGYKINIYQDDCNDSPADWGDDNLFLVAYHRDFSVEGIRVYNKLPEGVKRDPKDKGHLLIEKSAAVAFARNEPDGYDKELFKKYHVFGLEAYIHSGVVLALSQEGNFCDRQWDVSQLGLVFVAKKEWRIREKAKQAARGLIETWNDNLSGNVYGYMIEHPDGQESGGCWGYYGDPDKSGLVNYAQAEIESALKEDAEKNKIATQAMA